MLARSVPRTSARSLLIALMALNGITVSTLYWAQSIATRAVLELGPSLSVRLMPSATLTGYAVGVALLAWMARDLTSPNGLGLHALLLGVGLGIVAVAPAAPVVALACLLIGIGCSLTQRMLACATSVVPAEERAQVIGGIIASGLFGIVVARAGVPAASAALGWRTMFIIDASIVCLCGVIAALLAQRAEARADWTPTPAPLPSAWLLWRREKVLRRAALQQAGVFAAFNLGWAIFPHALAAGGSSMTIPMMGSVATLGAVAALIAGRACGHWNAADVARGGGCAVLLAGLLSLMAGGLGTAVYAVMALLDVGTQVSLVANQAQAQAAATSPAMRGRMAAIVTTVGFSAGALGAAIGNAVF